MPFALVTIGLLLVVTGFQNTYKQFGSQVAGDFTGQNNFAYWLVALGVIGGLGYIKPLEGFSRAFMFLIIMVLFLTKGQGFFAKIGPQLASGTAKGDNTIGVPLAGASGSGGGSSGSGFGGLDLSSLSTDFSAAVSAASILGI